MNQFKKAKVVMLPTKNKSKLVLSVATKRLDLIPYELELNDNYNNKPQHIYILSDDEIKDKDWFINNDGLWQCNNGIIPTGLNPRKIIATTDKSLTINSYDENNEFTGFIYLPQPSESFIQKYIESYNKGEIIADVLVEYEEILKCLYEIPQSCENSECRVLNKCRNEVKLQNLNYILKINPKDNTITIKKVKDSWNREEVIDLLYKFGSKMEGTEDIRPYTHYDKWIEENL